MLNPADIIVGDRLRALDRESVERLKESISRIGLKTPISVRSSAQGWTLVAGRHRLAACIELGINQIPVIAETSSELEARLWEIAENLHRAELTALERAEHISQWIKLRGERGAGEACDQADDKLDQVGPVSQSIPARGGRGRLSPSQDRRIAAAGGAECLRHAESSRCQGRPGPSDQRSDL